MFKVNWLLIYIKNNTITSKYIFFSKKELSYNSLKKLL